MVTALDAFNIAVSAAAAAGLLYLLYSGRYVVGYRRFFSLITFGLFLVVLGGPFLALVSPAIRHGVHGFATLFIAIGLYDLARVEMETERDWEDLLFADDAPPDVEPFEAAAELDD